MTQDIFLQLSGIAGESQDANHRDNIDVLSWEWQVYQAAALHGGNGGGAGKSSVNDLIIEHYTDRASPNLLKYCLTGKPIASATLVIRKAGGNPLEYLKITMHEVMITGVAITSDIHMAQPREEVSLCTYILDKDEQCGSSSNTSSRKRKETLAEPCQLDTT